MSSFNEILENVTISSNSIDIQLPFVSVCTPTFNRRPFIPFIKKCFEHQTYPKDRMEWIIIDDGFDPVGDLFDDVPQAKYFYFPEHMNLGKKRNLMHTKCSGDIIVYMDDDDYYPPERVSHAVEVLTSNPNILAAGSSEMHIYFDSIKSIMQFGPYGPNHATAATFAFKKELLLISSYDDNALLAEEKNFLQNYTVPFIQLNTLKTILVFSHKHNSLNKDKMLENAEVSLAKPSRYNIYNFMNDPELINFYVKNVNSILETYEPGNSKYKPKILEEIKKVEERQRTLKIVANRMNEFGSKYNTNVISLETIIMDYEEKISNKDFIISELIKKTKQYYEEINNLKNQLSQNNTTTMSNASQQLHQQTHQQQPNSLSSNKKNKNKNKK